MQRNTINRPFEFSAKFLASKAKRNPFREAMILLAVVCVVGLCLDSIARAAGL